MIRRFCVLDIVCVRLFGLYDMSLHEELLPPAGKVRSTRKTISNSSLTSQDERALTDYYKIMRKQGYGRAREMIMYMATKAIKKNGNVMGEQLPDSKWWHSFCTRNNQPMSPDTEEYVNGAKQPVNDTLLNNCTQQLSDALCTNKYGINFLEHPELIFCCNENVFELDETLKQILHLKEGFAKERASGEPLNSDVTHEDSRVDGKISVSLVNDIKPAKSLKTSVITCVNALGHSLPPFFVHSPPHSDAPRGSYERYAQERLDDDFFLLWFHEVFLQNPARRGPCVLIYDGQNCFVTREMLMAASVNDVIMFCVPANCTEELQPIDMTINGVFSDVWKSSIASKEIDGDLTHPAFARIFKDVWCNVATEVVIAERFKAVGIFPFSRHNVAPSSLGNVFENDDFGQERFSAFLGPDSDVNLQTRKKDSFMNLAMKSPRSNVDKQIDGNQNFMRPTGRITRPTMSILNQPLNEAPSIVQMIGDEDGFREDFPEISNSADEFSSCSDEGGTSMVALSSNITSLPSLPTQKSATESISYSPTDHVTSPTMAPQKRHHVPKATDVNFHDRQVLSTAGPVRNMTPQYQRVIHSVPGSRKRSNPFTEMRSNNTKAYPMSIRHPHPQETRPGHHSRVPPANPGDLRALEEILDQGRIAKFQKAFDDGLPHSEDNDPLYPVWRSIKLKYAHCTSVFRSDLGLGACQVNQVSPSVIEITPKTTGLVSNISRPALCHSNRTCQCSDSLRTILTPAGNVSVNRNATVIVILPERQELLADNSTATIDSNGAAKEQANRSTSV